MQSITPILLALFLTNLYLHVASDEYFYFYCNYASNYTVNSTYGSNLDRLFSSLSKESVAIQGFSASTIGASQDQISGLVLCRGDVNSSICGKCLKYAVTDLINICAYSKAGAWYREFCLLGYSNQNFLNSTDNMQETLPNVHNMTGNRFSGWDPTSNAVKNYFNTLVNTLLSNVADQAAYKSTKRFGTGMINISSSVPVIYGLSQCRPDFSNNTCRACLQSLIDQMLKYFDGRQGGRFLGVRCSLRYEIYTFFYGNPDIQIGSISATIIQSPQASGNGSTQTQPSLMNSPSSASKGGKSRRLIIISSVVALLIIGCFIGFLLIRKWRYTETEIAQQERMLITNETLDQWSTERSSDFPFFKFNQIANATENFSLDNKLGEGGFGPVYKGVLKDGLEIAVKRLSARSGQGLIEFRNEIQLIAKLQHRNLVRLMGWCIQGEEKILIYEFMPNKSLDYFIFDNTRGALLNWERRFEIVDGIAQGLLYLHKHSRLRIVHRDLKASNILLDLEMNPKISDFGLARIFSQNELQANTNRVVGTYGYMAPEYASEGLFSIKSDVFSFGVLLLEIVSGQRNVGFHQCGENFLNLLGYAWDRWKGGNISELICHTLTEVSQTQMERCIHVGLLCVQENPGDRPIMSDVIIFLTTEGITLPEPKQPAYFNVRVTEVVKSSDFDGSSCSVNDVTLTNPDVR